MLSFFDYIVDSPQHELKQAFFRIDAEHLGNFTSLQGRAVCVLRVVTHTASLVLKPAYYFFSGLACMLMVHMCFTGVLRTVLNQAPPSDLPDFIRDFLIVEDNPELRDRIYMLFKNLMLTAPVSIVSQMIQVGKAALGILIPGIYFRNDYLAPLLHRLANVARDVGCHQALIDKLDEGVAALQFEGFYREYFYAEYIRDLTAILPKLEDPSIPHSRKLSLISMLNPEPTGSGIEACPAGLGRILQQMRASIDVPENPAEITPHLLTQFKEDILSSMIYEVDHARDQSSPQWQRVLRRLAIDPAHRSSALVSVIGDEIGLSESRIRGADLDGWITSQGIQLSAEDRALLLNEFNRRYARENQVVFLQRVINSQPDGSPGLRRFREQIIQALTSLVTPAMLQEAHASEGSEAVYTLQRYQINCGLGDPTGNPGFNDLNSAAIEAILERQDLFVAV